MVKALVPVLLVALLGAAGPLAADPFSKRMPANAIEGKTRWRSTRKFVAEIPAVADHTARSEHIPRKLAWVDRMNLEASTRVPRWLDEIPTTHQAWMRFDPLVIPREALIERVIMRVAYRKWDGDLAGNPIRAFLTFRGWQPGTLTWQSDYLAVALDDPVVVDGNRISFDITRLARGLLTSRGANRGFSVVLGPEFYPASAVRVPATADGVFTEDRLYRTRGRSRRAERQEHPNTRLVLYSRERPDRSGPVLVVHYRLPVPSAAPVTE